MTTAMSRNEYEAHENGFSDSPEVQEVQEDEIIDRNGGYSAVETNDRQYEQHPGKQPTASSDPGPGYRQSEISKPEVKNVKLFRNGDIFSQPKKFVVSRKKCRTFDAFLHQVNEGLRLNGAVREIKTPRNGTRINNLEELEPSGVYVAVPAGEKMKFLNYQAFENISPRRLNQNGARNPLFTGSILAPIRPVFHSRLRIGGRIEYEMKKKGKTIYVYRNADPFTRAICILLRTFEQEKWELVLRAIDERVILVNNTAIRRLYNMDGTRCLNANDLQDSQYYVATGFEPFVAVPYGQTLPGIRAGKVERRNSVKFLNAILSPPKGKNRATPRKQELSDRSNFQHHPQEEDSAKKRMARFQEEMGSIQTQPQATTLRAQNQPYYQNQQQQQQQQQPRQKLYNEVDYDEDQGGVFKAKSNGRSHLQAEQVNDTAETRTELPVSQREAETIEEDEQFGFSAREAEEDGESPEASTPENERFEERKRKKKTLKKKPKNTFMDDEGEDVVEDVEEETEENVDEDAEKDADGDEEGVKENVEKDMQVDEESAEKDEADPEEKLSDEKPQPTQEEKDAAASTIQAGFRGMKARESVRKEEAAEKSSADQKEAYNDDNLTSTQEQNNAKNLAKDDEDKMKAATTIQANYRGYKTRKDLANTNDE